MVLFSGELRIKAVVDALLRPQWPSGGGRSPKLDAVRANLVKAQAARCKYPLQESETGSSSRSVSLLALRTYLESGIYNPGG